MITLEKEQLKEYLIRAFDEGFCGYKDLQEEFIVSLLAEIENVSGQAQSAPVVMLGGYDEHGQFISSPEPSVIGNNWSSAASVTWGNGTVSNITPANFVINSSNPIQITSSHPIQITPSSANSVYSSGSGYTVNSDFHYD